MNNKISETEAPIYDGYYKYDCVVAQDYESSRVREPHWHYEDQFIEGYFGNRQINSLLDLPVGTGRFFRHYRNVRSLVGVDISEAMLEEARKKLPLLPLGTSTRLECGDVFSLGFVDREFDVALVCRLFHLIPQNLLAKAIKELCRVTGGEIIVQTYVPTKVEPIRLWRGQLRSMASRIIRRILPIPVQTPTPKSNADAKPWSHIQAYYHKQSLVDSLFADCGFFPSGGKLLDEYEGTHVRITIYSKKAC